MAQYRPVPISTIARPCLMGVLSSASPLMLNQPAMAWMIAS